MDQSYKKFMGLKTPSKSNADYLLGESLKEIYKMLMNTGAPIPSIEKTNIDDFIAECRHFKPEYDYFWDWMQEKGYSLLSQLDRRLPNTDEIVDFLTYRKMILEMDAMNDSIDMFFVSITEFLVSATEFLSAYFETAAAMQQFSIKEHVQLPSNEWAHEPESHWEYIESSAPLGAELLLYS